MAIPSMLPYGERKVISLIQSRSEKVFSDLYDAYAPALYGIILKQVPGKMNEAVVLQSTFACIWLHIEQYDAGMERLFTWMVHIAIHESSQFNNNDTM